MRNFLVALFLLAVFAVKGQKLENTLSVHEYYRVNGWWSLSGSFLSHIGYADVNWKSAGVRGGIRYRANGWISLEVGAMWAYIYDNRTFREQEFRTHQAMFVRRPEVRRFRTMHEFRMEQRSIHYKPVDVRNESSRIIYRAQPRVVISSFSREMEKGVWFAEGLAAFNFNLKSELPESDFFQRATLGAGIGYVMGGNWQVMAGWSHQLGRSKPYYYAEEHGLNSINISFRHAIP